MAHISLLLPCLTQEIPQPLTSAGVFRVPDLRERVSVKSHLNPFCCLPDPSLYLACSPLTTIFLRAFFLGKSEARGWESCYWTHIPALAPLQAALCLQVSPVLLSLPFHLDLPFC